MPLRASCDGVASCIISDISDQPVFDFFRFSRQISGSSLTDPLRAHAVSKLNKPIERHADLLREGDASVELQLKVESRSKHDEAHIGKEAHIAEVTAHCKDKHVIHCAATTEDMYASIDELTDTLTRQLEKYKGKRITVKEDRKRSSKEALLDEAMGIAEDDE